MDSPDTPAKAGLRPVSRIDHPCVPILLFAAIAAFLFGTVQRGEDWSGDSALYILNARNIALGLPYARTDYIVNPANPIHPAAYPPGLPLLLAPIYRVGGIDLFAMKALCLACFVLFLALYWRIARDALSPPLALLTTAALGLHPFLWYCARYIASEFPFMLFCYGALYSLDRLQQRSFLRLRVPTIILAAVAVALACATRTIGVVLFPAAVLAGAFDRRPPDRRPPDRSRLAATFAALALASALILGVQLAFPADLRTYTGYFQGFGLHSIAEAARSYLSVRVDLIGEAAARLPVLGAVLSAGLAAICALGFLARTRQRVSVFEGFFLGYAAFLLIYPVYSEASRYSLPLWPLVFLYGARGMGVLARALGSAARPWTAVAVVTLIAGLYVARYTSLTFGPVPYSMDAPESRALYAAIRREVPASATVLARKPTVIALYTQRRAMIWPEHFTDRELWAFMAGRHIGYLLQDIHLPGGHAWPPDALDLFIARNRPALETVFANPWFRLYRLRITGKA